MAVSIAIGITQNSQSIANNKSNCTVKVTASWTGGSNNRAVNASGVPQAKGWVKIDGKSYDFASTFNDKQTTTGSKVIFTKTLDITHNTNGTKKLDVSASYDTYVSSGTVTASASKTLTTIPRKSTLSVGNGELETKQTLTVTEQASGFKHTITAKCGNDTRTICTKSDSNTVYFIPPADWAKQNTTGTNLSVTYTITTYSGDTNIGSNTYTKSCKIPDKEGFKPSCTIDVNDATGYYDSYVDYIKGYSKFAITITPKLAYGSAITSYKTTANGATYTSAIITTDVLKVSGKTVTISATVTDSRGLTSSVVTKTVEVLDYSPPSISAINVGRGDVNENGEFTDNDQGEYVKVAFDYSCSDLEDKNAVKSCTLSYKKTSDDNYTTPADFDPDIGSIIGNATYIFAADTESSYDVKVTVEDNIETVSKVTSVSTAFTVRHYRHDGHGVALGKMCEEEIDDVFDIGFATRFTGGLLYPVIEPETDLNDVRTPGFYVGANVSSNNYVNCPLTSGTFTLEVLSAGDNKSDPQILQRLTRCYKLEPTVYERFYYSGSWGEWYGGWIFPTLESGFAPYDSNSNNKPKFRKDGRIVEVRGIVTPTADIAGSTTIHLIFTLPEGYRPDSPIYTICQGTGNCTWLLRVATNGEVGFSRYRNGDATATAAASNWLPFQVTFIV